MTRWQHEFCTHFLCAGLRPHNAQDGLSSYTTSTKWFLQSLQNGEAQPLPSTKWVHQISTKW